MESRFYNSKISKFAINTKKKSKKKCHDILTVKKQETTFPLQKAQREKQKHQYWQSHFSPKEGEKLIYPGSPLIDSMINPIIKTQKEKKEKID